MIDSVNISGYDLEFDKDYKLYMYVTYQHYDVNTGIINDVTYPFYEDEEMAKVYLNPLSTPNFVFSREAKYVDGEYLIDLKINVSDTDRVLNNGKYFVKIVDTKGDSVGDLQVLDEDNNYITVGVNGEYTDYEFDALTVNRSVRIKGLSENTKYVAHVYGSALINNATLEEKDIDIEV